MRKENKYSKILNKSWRLLMGIVMILAFSALLCTPILLLIDKPKTVIDILFLILLSLCGFFIYQGVSIGFLNQEYEVTGYVHDGETVIAAKQTPKYVKRTMWFCFIEFIAHIILAIYFFVRSSITEYAIVYNVMAIISIVIAIVYFLNAGKRKVDLKNYEQSKK